MSLSPKNHKRLAVIAFVLASTVSACGGGAGDSSEQNDDARDALTRDQEGGADGDASDVPVGSDRSKSVEIGPEGGTVTLAGNAGPATVEIPAGALAATVSITITELSEPVPSGYTAYSPLYRFAPSGLTFAKPIKVTLPFRGDRRLVALFWSRAVGGGYERVGGVPQTTNIVADVTHFSTGFAADGVEYTDPPDRSCTVVRVLKTQRYGGSGQVPFFTVDDCDGRPITDLTCASYPGDCDFVLSEDGTSLSSEASAVVLPSKGVTPFIALTIDMSSSTQSVLSEVIAGAKAFVHKLQGNGNPLLVQIAVYAFAGGAQVAEIQKPTLDEAVLLAKLDSLASFGPSDPSSTNLYGAVVDARARIASAQAAFEARNFGGALTTGYLVLFTDGRDTAGIVSLDEVRRCSEHAASAGQTQCFRGTGGGPLAVTYVNGQCPSNIRSRTCPDGSCCTGDTHCERSLLSWILPTGSGVPYRCIPDGSHLCSPDDPTNGGSFAEGSCPDDSTCTASNSCCCDTAGCNQREAERAYQATCQTAAGTVGNAEVLAVALKTSDYDRAALEAIAGTGLIESVDQATLERDFAAAANRIVGRVKRSYLLGYCSPKRSGVHTVSIAVAGSRAGSSATYEFDATGYGPGCNTAAFETACTLDGQARECGGLGCGACDDRTSACASASSQCIDNCIAQHRCGGMEITNPQGYRQACDDQADNRSCGGQCVNPLTNNAHCGECGVVCHESGGEHCDAGACKCPAGRSLCDGVCYDLANAKDHCGSCERACPVRCEDGQCSDTVPGFERIAAGTFTMGSPSAEVGRNSGEVQHQVTLTRTFWMKRTEVTQGEWQAVMGANPSNFGTCGADCPVENITWFSAAAYTNALSQAEGLETCYVFPASGCAGTAAAGTYSCGGAVTFKGVGCAGYRLPTEAEWEYAARAGTMTATYNGNLTNSGGGADPVLDPIAWYSANASNKTHPVAAKLPNAWGLYDMLGNVYEWTQDWDMSAPWTGAQTDPVHPESGVYRVIRGGCWGNDVLDTRAARRDAAVPAYRDDGAIGLRPLRSVP